MAQPENTIIVIDYLNYSIVISSTTIITTRDYSKTWLTDHTQLNPWWIIGIVDGEGSFGIRSQLSKANDGVSKRKTGLQFKVTQKSRISRYPVCSSVFFLVVVVL